MNTRYVKAVEIRADWLKWSRGDGINVWRKSGASLLESLPLYRDNLQNGDTFFMNDKFAELVDHARMSVPDDLKFDPTWMQTESGWMWIEKPFTVPQPQDLRPGLPPTQRYKELPLELCAVGWRKMLNLEGTHEYQFFCYQDLALYYKYGFRSWSYFVLKEGDEVTPRIHKFENETAAEIGAYENTPASDMKHEIRWVYAAFYLMSQHLTVTLHRETDRALRRRAEREKKLVTPTFKVIALRRQEEARARAEQAATQRGEKIPIDWQWRWDVKGHWRKQFYRSTSEYKNIYIESYIKGPENKPLKPPGSKIFAAVR